MTLCCLPIVPSLWTTTCETGLWAGIEGFHLVDALRPARLNVLIYWKDDILLHVNCAKCVHYCIWSLKVLFMLFWRCVSGAHVALFLHKWLKCCGCICFSKLGTCTPCYVFISLKFHASGHNQYFQSRPYKNKYVHETFHNSNTRQQCPDLDTVDVEMCKEPHTHEDAPMVSS